MKGFGTMRQTATSRRRRADRDLQQSLVPVNLETNRVRPVVAPTTWPKTRRESGTMCATVGDHASIQQLLTCCHHRMTAAEFQAQLDEPGYEPSHRVIIKHDGRVIAHMHVARRELQFGCATIPTCVFTDLVVLPEYRSWMCERFLTAAAERQATESGALLAYSVTRHPAWCQSQGWAIGPRHSYSEVGPRPLVSHITSQLPSQSDLFSAYSENAEAPQLTVRLWRRMEQDALRRLHELHSRSVYGAIHRSESYWEWLVNRRGFDRIYVAIDGPNRLDLEESSSRICGYAVLRAERLLELVSAPQCDAALPALLMRTCQDAVERDWHPVRLEGPPNHGMHALAIAAGGRLMHHDVDQGEAVFVKLLDIPGFVRTLYDELLIRSRQLGAARIPLDLNLLCDGRKQRLVITRRTAKLLPGHLGRGGLVCTEQELTQMLIGRGSVDEVIDPTRLAACSRGALEIARCLFPRRPLWFSAWDQARA